MFLSRNHQRISWCTAQQGGYINAKVNDSAITAIKNLANAAYADQGATNTQIQAIADLITPF